MAKNWYPIIDEASCIACGICVAHCKRGVYDTRLKKATVIAPDNCSFRCECCSKKCPVEAISYFKETTLFNIVKG